MTLVHECQAISRAEPGSALQSGDMSSGLSDAGVTKGHPCMNMSTCPQPKLLWPRHRPSLQATSMVEDFRHDPSKANPGESSGRYSPPGGATACLGLGASRGTRDRRLTVQVGCGFKAASAPQQQRAQAARAWRAVRPAVAPAGRVVRMPVGF